MVSDTINEWIMNNDSEGYIANELHTTEVFIAVRELY